MANYERKFKSSIWSTVEFEKLNATEKAFYFLLITGEETSDTSIFALTVGCISYRLNVTRKKALELIDSFQQKGLIDYDYETEEVLVICYFKHNPNNGGLKYEHFSKDMNKIQSKRLFAHLAEVAKQYPITIGYFAALKEHIYIEVSDYTIKKSKEDEESVKTVAQRGREKIDEKRRNANALPETLDNEPPFPPELPDDLPY